MHIQLLGYSESTIARILDTLWDSGHRSPVTIIQNIEVAQAIPFCPTGMSVNLISWKDWKLETADVCLPAVTKPLIKKKVVDFFSAHCNISTENFTTLIHPSAVVAISSVIGKGCFIEPQTVIASFAELGFGVYVNRGSTIGHHTRLGDRVSTGPGVHIAGHCTIGNDTQIGVGAVVFDHVHIGENVVIGGGSIVNKDIPDNVIAWGNPCKVMRKNNVE